MVESPVCATWKLIKSMLRGMPCHVQVEGFACESGREASPRGHLDSQSAPAGFLCRRPVGPAAVVGCCNPALQAVVPVNHLGASGSSASGEPAFINSVNATEAKWICQSWYDAIIQNHHISTGPPCQRQSWWIRYRIAFLQLSSCRYTHHLFCGYGFTAQGSPSLPLHLVPPIQHVFTSTLPVKASS